jgi:hypothetical protein
MKLTVPAIKIPEPGTEEGDRPSARTVELLDAIDALLAESLAMTISRRRGLTALPSPAHASPAHASPAHAGTVPAGTAPAGTAPAGTAPAGTAPAGTAPPDAFHSVMPAGSGGTTSSAGTAPCRKPRSRRPSATEAPASPGRRLKSASAAPPEP